MTELHDVNQTIVETDSNPINAMNEMTDHHTQLNSLALEACIEGNLEKLEQLIAAGVNNYNECAIEALYSMAPHRGKIFERMISLGANDYKAFADVAEMLYDFDTLEYLKSLGAEIEVWWWW